jgi:hypothetical protein
MIAKMYFLLKWTILVTLEIYLSNLSRYFDGQFSSETTDLSIDELTDILPRLEFHPCIYEYYYF